MLKFATMKNKTENWPINKPLRIKHLNMSRLNIVHSKLPKQRLSHDYIRAFNRLLQLKES